MYSFISHPLVAAIILIAILIFVHEFGHFIVGRLCGIGVEVFSIGFGPTICSFKYKDVTYKLCWLPLGGYVKFYGAYPLEEVPDNINGIKFLDASAFKKMLTVLAGPVFNFLFAVIGYVVLANYGIAYQEAVIGEVRSGSVADVVGLLPDDKIVEVNGTSIKNWDELRKIIASSANKKLDVKVQRNSGYEIISVVPEEVETKDIFGKQIKEGKFGISIARSDSSFYMNQKDGSIKLLKVNSIVEDDGSKIDVRYAQDLYSYIDKKIKQLFMKKDDNSFQKLDVKLNLDGDKDLEFSLHFDAQAKDSGKSLCQKIGLFPALLVVGDKAIEEKEASLFLENQDTEHRLKRGDRILKWNGLVVRDIYDLSQIQMNQKEPQVPIEILRDSKNIVVNVNLLAREVQLPSGKETLYILPNEMFGQLKSPETKYEKYGFFSSLLYGVTQTAYQTKELTISLVKLITGSIPLQALGGPMMIAKVASDSVKAGVNTFLGTLAIISINLGVLNLFPIPLLDGGQFVIFTIELIRRKRASQVVIDSYQKIGFIMVMALVVLVTYNDFSRFWTSMLKTLSNWTKF